MLYPDGKDSSICISKGFDFYAIVYKNHGGGGKESWKGFSNRDVLPMLRTDTCSIRLK